MAKLNPMTTQTQKPAETPKAPPPTETPDTGDTVGGRKPAAIPHP